MHSTPEWSCQEFKQLSTDSLYSILRLRAEVFIVEQECHYQDLDGCDQAGLHLSGFIEGRLACYARLLPPGLKYPEASIGRVVTSPGFRKLGLGKQLMSRAIEHCSTAWPGTGITISAQLYLESFYQGFGFNSAGASYLEDDIPHIRMTWQPQ